MEDEESCGSVFSIGYEWVCFILDGGNSMSGSHGGNLIAVEGRSLGVLRKTSPKFLKFWMSIVERADLGIDL